MEESVYTAPMDLKASAEVEVRKLQDMVKELERQNELLRHTQQNGSYTTRKRESLDLEEVALINLNESPDELEESWLYESPVKQATPAQKSISSVKWMKVVNAEGLDDVRKCLIDKLDDIEAQQEITKVRLSQKPEESNSLPQNSLFFQPTKRNSPVNGRTGPRDREINLRRELPDNRKSDSSSEGSLEDLEDELQGPPILRRSLVNKPSTNPASQRQPVGYNSPLENRKIISANSSEDQSDASSTNSIEELDGEFQGPILRRSAIAKQGGNKSSVQQSQNKSQMGSSSPLESRRTASASTSGLRRSSSPTLDDNIQPVQPRSRRVPQLGDGNESSRSGIETTLSNLDDMDEDIDDTAPIVRRSALALPKPSSEGLSKQLWYSGPINQMNRQKTKPSPAASRVRRSASPSPDRRSKPQPKAATGVVRRSTGSRGSMEDLLDHDDNAPIQRRSLPQVPTDSSAAARSRLAKPDDAPDSRSQMKPRSRTQNVMAGGTSTPTGPGVVTRRSLLTPPTYNSSVTKDTKVLARRRAPPAQGNRAMDDSWKEGCY